MENKPLFKMTNRIKLEMVHDDEAYSLERAWILKFGVSNLAYGSTPQEAFDNYQRIFRRS